MDPQPQRERRRLERLADIEGMGRQANEEIARGWRDGPAPAGPSIMRCECGNPDCHDPLRISRDLYESVRGDSMLFLVRPGHDVPEAEHVVTRGDDYWIVRKEEDVRERVERSDPRRHIRRRP